MAPPSLIKLCDFLENSRKTWLCCRTMKRTVHKLLTLKQLKHKWRLSSSEKKSLQGSRLVAAAAAHPVSSCRLLPACLLSPPAFLEHKLWRTAQLQETFVKHHVRPFLVLVSPGDLRLGSTKWTEQRRGSRHQVATDACRVKEVFLCKRQTAEKQLFDPCCLRDSRERKVFLWSLLSVPYAAWFIPITTKPKL